VLLGVLAGVVVLGLVAVLGGGSARSRECRDYDAAQARYDQVIGAGEEVPAELVADLARLHAACTAAGR
jgi:hypothetical protein